MTINLPFGFVLWRTKRLAAEFYDARCDAEVQALFYLRRALEDSGDPVYKVIDRQMRGVLQSKEAGY